MKILICMWMVCSPLCMICCHNAVYDKLEEFTENHAIAFLVAVVMDFLAFTWFIPMAHIMSWID